MDIPWIFLFLLLIYCDGQKLELEKKERLAKVLEDIRAKIISDDDSEYVEGSGVGNDEQFVANLVVRPGFPVDKHKPTLQFMPHFENDFFEFMVPEGVSDKPGVMAILLFYGILDSSLPEFSLSGNGSEFLEIGDLTVTQTQNYALIEVPILKQGNLNLPYSNGSFLLTITAKQKGMENKANLLVEIIPVTGVEFLSIRPGSLDLTQGQDYVDEDVASGEAPAEVAPKVQGPPVIEIVVKGAKDGIFSVSESLLRFSRVPGVEIEVNVRNYSNPTDYIELSLEPSDVFAARPQMVSPGEPVQLVVLDSNALDFEATPKELHFKLNARLRGKFKSVAKESVHLVAEKVDESDQPPVFERERYMFGIDTEWKHDSEVGEVKAVDLDSAQNIQYTLLGHGSQKFKLHNGILYVDCGMSEKCFDKGHEYHLLALAVDQTGQTSKPASIMIKVESTVSEECYIEVPSKELTVRNGKLQYPFNFVVNNIRRSIIPKFTVKLDGKAKKYFEIEALTKRLHNLKLIQEIPDGKYSLDLVLGQKSGKQRTRITVVSKNESQVKFKKHNHTVTLATVKTGLAVLTVDLTGKRPKHVKFVINGITSNWVSINPKSGQVTVTQTPKASETLRFTVTAYNTKTGKILDEATVTLKYKGEKPVEADTSSKVLYYHKEGLKFKKDRSLKTQKIVGYNHNRQQVVVSDGKYNGSPNGDMYISYDLLKMFNYMQVFFAGPFDKQVIYTLLNEDPSNNRKPVFVSPWMSDFEEITVTDVPSDSHRDIICLPCVYNGHTIGNVTLTSDLNVVYSTKTGCLHTFEKIQGEHKIRLECYNDDEKTTATIKLATVATVNSVQLKDKTVTISENENSTVIAKYSVPNASKFKFELSGENSDLFYVTVTADEVTVKASSKLNFDFEDTKSYALFVTVVDSSGGRKTALLLITVLDVNDNYPVITVVPKVLHTYSHWTKDVTVTSIRARDADSGDNGKLQYEILEASFLKIDRTSGIVTVSEDLEPFGREEPYIVTLKVADHGDPAKSTILDIPVYVHTVIEAFDKQIEILSPSENCIVEISEDEKINSTVFNAKAVLKGMDLDDALLKYYIKPESESASDFLQMDEETGDMRLLKLLDYEELSHLTVSSLEQ
ncbi:unnamed protein product [Bursaphelenchus okinawaensis]|uniref:Cadherin domain-containing protein n=1 Tax=Bursaphelenchus okinawaensis TaxID=465554 RepID=A0A811KVZ8_9BILA|nr:unnamed protein product [Bursaphelenchus okinawaensis]CAG9112705.1 unnamed protein product [Bursaphelenchus okinawaensis]